MGQEARWSTTRTLDALLTLPRDAAGIAAFLAERGDVGRQTSAAQNPIARYVSAAVGRPVAIYPSHAFVAGDGWSVMVNLPQGMVDFLIGFDAGEWLDLVEGVAS